MRNSFLAVVSLLAMCGAALGAVTVTVSSPANNYSGASPIRMVASATSPNGMSSMAIFVDGTRVYFNWGSSLTAYVWMTAGTHTVLVQGTDNTGATGSKQLSLTTTTSGGTVSNIDDWPGWQNCTAANCAGGNGTSTTWTAANQSSPSRDGASREFYLGGTPGYSNAYWYKLVGGSASVTNFTYDFWFYVDQPKVPQAVEFDVNQSFSQKRWVFGTECNVATGVWDVWNGGTGSWVATTIPCALGDVSGNPIWHHVIWKVYRTGNAVHYASVTIDGHFHGVGAQLGNQPNWTGSDIDVAVQLDGNAQQTPYHVWIDSMNLSAVQ